MKKIFFIFLIFSFLFNTAGYILFFFVVQSVLKEKAVEKILSGEFTKNKVLVVFSNLDLKRGIPELNFFNENEFSFKGKMYDIIEKEDRNDSTYLYCLADIEEDELNLTLNKKTKSVPGEDDKNSSHLSLLKNILQDALLSNNPSPSVKITETKYYKGNFVLVSSHISDIQTPPPITLPV